MFPPLRRLASFALAASAALFSKGTLAHSQHDKKPVIGRVLARVDASASPGGFLLATHDETSGAYEASAGTLGPRLAFNFGYAPSRLVRLGLGFGADFAMNLFESQGIPSTQIDGWTRWFVGPTVGFRFGPRVPLELEASVAFANTASLGNGGTPLIVGARTVYDFESPFYGMVNGAILYYRPDGPRSPFAVHGGVHYGWGFEGNSERNATFFTWSLLLGVSVGL